VGKSRTEGYFWWKEEKQAIPEEGVKKTNPQQGSTPFPRSQGSGWPGRKGEQNPFLDFT